MNADKEADMSASKAMKSQMRAERKDKSIKTMHEEEDCQTELPKLRDEELKLHAQQKQKQLQHHQQKEEDEEEDDYDDAKKKLEREYA